MTARSEMRRRWKEYMKKSRRKMPFPAYVDMVLKIVREKSNANTHMEK